MKGLAQKFADLFHSGRLPDEDRRVLETEGGVAYLAGGVASTVTLEDFRAPGIACG